MKRSDGRIETVTEMGAAIRIHPSHRDLTAWHTSRHAALEAARAAGAFPDYAIYSAAFAALNERFSADMRRATQYYGVVGSYPDPTTPWPRDEAGFGLVI